jgi:hypothetical protein
MDCNQVGELAPLYLSGELDRERAGAIDAHLQSCPSCMGELESQARLDARMREAIDAEGVDATGVERWVRARISDESRSKVASISSRPPQAHRRRWLIAAVAVAAVALLAAVTYLDFVRHAARVYADAASDHQREVIRQEPRRWLSDRAAISELAEQQGIAASAPFALSSGPYHLERARLCFLDGKIFLHAVYTDGEREFSVYFRVRDGQALPGGAQEIDNGRVLHTSAVGAQEVAGLQTNDLTVMVVSDRDSGDALHVARLAAETL